MGNAIWLLRVLPDWFLTTVADPFSAGALSLVPAVGTVSLAVGLIIAVIQRHRGLLLFLLPFLFSECLVALAGIMRGQVSSDGATILQVALLAFLAIQVGICGYLTYRLKGARWAGTALSIFSIAYAAFSMFVATMSFTDTWL